MYRSNRFLKTISVDGCVSPFTDDAISSPCVNLGTRLRDQMYHGADSSSSTLLTGEFDDEDSWDVDPACDMTTDRFELDLKSPVPVAETSQAE